MEEESKCPVPGQCVKNFIRDLSDELDEKDISIESEEIETVIKKLYQ